MGNRDWEEEIEANRLAYQDRNAFVADPNMAAVPQDLLLSKGYADRLRQMDQWVAQLLKENGKTPDKAEWSNFRDKLFTGWNL